MARKRKFLRRGLKDISSISVTEITQPLNLPIAVPAMPQKLARVICVTSGKGGTGKSILTSNLATCFAKAGQKVVVLDADMGLANLHLLLGVAPRYDIADILNGKTIQEVMLKTDFGFDLIPGGSGILELANLNEYQINLLATVFEELETNVDVLLIDMPAGIASQAMAFLHATNEIVMVTTPETTAVTDAYATIKVTCRDNPDVLIGVIINRIQDQSEGKVIFSRLNMITNNYLNKNLTYLGSIWEDRIMRESIAARIPVTRFSPDAIAARCINKIANQIALAGETYRDKLELATGAFFGRIQKYLEDRGRQNY